MPVCNHGDAGKKADLCFLMESPLRRAAVRLRVSPLLLRRPSLRRPRGSQHCNDLRALSFGTTSRETFFSSFNRGLS